MGVILIDEPDDDFDKKQDSIGEGLQEALSSTFSTSCRLCEAIVEQFSNWAGEFLYSTAARDLGKYPIQPQMATNAGNHVTECHGFFADAASRA
mgnify:CR=1 FL=1